MQYNQAAQEPQRRVPLLQQVEPQVLQYLACRQRAFNRQVGKQHGYVEEQIGNHHPLDFAGAEIKKTGLDIKEVARDEEEQWHVEGVYPNHQLVDMEMTDQHQDDAVPFGHVYPCYSFLRLRHGQCCR